MPFRRWMLVGIMVSDVWEAGSLARRTLGLLPRCGLGQMLAVYITHDVVPFDRQHKLSFRGMEPPAGTSTYSDFFRPYGGKMKVGSLF